MQTGWRLERTYLAGAGYPESRLEGLDISWADPAEPTGHAALWADNGTGKTTITALRFALYLPNLRDFVRGDSDRSLARLIYSGNVCHVVEQATREVNGELQRIVMGMVADWPDGGTQNLDNPSRLQRDFYGWVTGPRGPAISDLPFRTASGRWATRAQFTDATRALAPGGGALPPHLPSDHQAQWQQWLMAAGIDLEQIRFQAAMNASEGGVDNVMRFADSDGFVKWLIGAITQTSTAEQVTRSIDALRANAKARLGWADELALWEKVTDPLLKLAIAHEQVTASRRAAATAEMRAATVVADADVTKSALALEKETAGTRHAEHDRRRRDANATLRRAQAHRLRMQLRGASLRADAAKDIAADHKKARDEAARDLAAWRIVEDVIAAGKTRSAVIRLTAELEAAEKGTSLLRQEEARHRRDLARLLTDRRDHAHGELTTARELLRGAEEKLKDAESALQTAVAERATAREQLRKTQEDATGAEQTITGAVTAGLLPEDTDPAVHDTQLAELAEAAGQAHDDAGKELASIGTQISGEQKILAAAAKRAEEAARDISGSERQLRDVTARIRGLTSGERLLTVVSDAGADPWVARAVITDALRRSADSADQEAAQARQAAAAAHRTIEAVGSDGLLPAARLTEDAVRRCQDAEVPAWPGWRWLADTMTPGAAAAFARARPEIASGVVISSPAMLGEAAEAVSAAPLDTAIWVGVVTDTHAALRTGQGAQGQDGTRGHVLLPHQGTYDRQAATAMVSAATKAAADAHDRQQAAALRAASAREMLAALNQFWTDTPTDPRPGLEDRIHAARIRKEEGQAGAEEAERKLTRLRQRQEEHAGSRDTAQETLNLVAETRRLLAPAVAAGAALASAQERLPALRQAVSEAERRTSQLSDSKPALAAKVKAASALADGLKRRRDDAAEALRAAGLSPVTDGPVPPDDEETIRARLVSTEEALEGAAIDPELHEHLRTARGRLADLNAGLGTDPARRELAEQLAASDGARHPVALSESLREAADREASARESYAKAQHAAETAEADYQRRAEDRSADRSSPDIEGFPADRDVTTPAEADQVAEQLDERATQLGETQRVEERAASKAAEDAGRAEQTIRLLDAAVKPLRYLADPALTGRRAPDVDALIARMNAAQDDVRETSQALSSSERAQEAAAGTVRAQANGPNARKVEEGGDVRVIDLIMRLRAGDDLAAEAERLAEQLEQRATSLRDDLERHDQNVRTCARMLHVQAATAIERLRAYQIQSQLPEGLGNWSQRRFVTIEHEPIPSDESVAVDRVARVIHSLLAPGAARSDAPSLLFAAARALVDAPFRVRLLKPHTDLSLDRVDVAELKNFSCGQRVTAGVLLYATMTRVRAAGDATSTGWLWLDNPFGQASADQFVRTMRRAADRLGLQLLFTAAPKDKGALSMFDRTIALARKTRPSSKEKVVVIDDGTREITDLLLIQKDVTAVLGE
ncbi:MAG TPA: hypothetical protein VMU94_25650 [Streptosporangiaceae bacterium]|nr:hypothetical protein [Streptosporangiaceae bacterium]